MAAEENLAVLRSNIHLSIRMESIVSLLGLHRPPWFHTSLSREAATTCVLIEGEAGHGTFLMRASKTRHDEIYLTMNYQGRAQHLRLVNEMSLLQGQLNSRSFVREELIRYLYQIPGLSAVNNASSELKEYIVSYNPQYPNLRVTHGSDLLLSHGELEDRLEAGKPGVRALERDSVLYSARIPVDDQVVPQSSLRRPTYDDDNVVPDFQVTLPDFLDRLGIECVTSSVYIQQILQHQLPQAPVSTLIVGKIKVIKGQLNVIHNVDISFINPHLDNINEIISNIRFVCQQTHTEQCDNILSPITVRYNDLSGEYESISHLVSKQKRSAWFGGIGTILKDVFGTLDEDDALKYDSAIQSLQRNEKKIVELVKENILATTSTTKSFQQLVNKIKTNDYILTNAVNELLENIKNITDTSAVLINSNKANFIFA